MKTCKSCNNYIDMFKECKLKLKTKYGIIHCRNWKSKLMGEIKYTKNAQGNISKL